MYVHTQSVIGIGKRPLPCGVCLITSEPLDRLLRYEAALDRSFDRTLTQLERLQRTRRGHPVPPPLKVDISGLEAGPIGPDARLNPHFKIDSS